MRAEVKRQLNEWFNTFVFTHILSFATGGVIGFYMGKIYEKP